MAMVVKNNMSAVSTLNTLNKNSSALQKSLQKVSSGMKINSAQDDASGYAISEKMRVQIRSLDQANQNTQNASSMMKTAEGAVSSTVEILKSLKEKAINAATDTNTDSDRVTIQKELDQFIDQIDDNALTTFNGKYLVDGSKSQQGKATHTAMTNQSLASDTNGATALTALKNRNNESLEIESTDYVTASFVKNGATYTTKFLVGQNNNLDDVFANMNDEYQTVTGGTDTAFAGTAAVTAAGSSGGDSAGTVKTATDIAGMDPAKLLAAAQGTIDADLAATKADSTGAQVGTDLAQKVTDAVDAIKAKYTQATTGTGYAIGATYDDADGNAQTVAADAATPANFVTALQNGIGSAVQAAAEKAAKDTATTSLDGIKSAIGAVIDSLRSPNTATAAPTGLTSTDLATEVEALAKAVLAQQAYANGSSAAAAAPSDFKSVNGTDINKSNADSYIMSSEDVDKMAQTYGVSRTTDDTDETYAAKVLYAAIDKGTETDGNDKVTDRGVASKVTYKDGTFNSVADKDKYGAVNGAAGSYDAMFLNPDKVVDTSTGKMQAYKLSDTAPVAGADYDADSETGVDKVVDDKGIQSTGAAAIQDAYNRFVNSTALGNGTTYNDGTVPATVDENSEKKNIKAVFDDISKLADHISALNAKNQESEGIINNVTYGSSVPSDGEFGIAQSNKDGDSDVDKGLIGVNSAGDKVYTADGTPGLTVTATTSGVQGQVSGVTISISDSEGNVKKSANAALDQFRTTIYAKNESSANELSFQVGGAANQSIAVGLDDMRSEALGLKGSDGTKVSVATQDKANAAVAVFDNAIQKALDQQTTIGAVEARLDYTSQNLTTSSENVQAAESTIRDADMAKEMTNYTKNNVLLQAAQSMLAQANQSSSQVLSLLQ